MSWGDVRFTSAISSEGSTFQVTTLLGVLWKFLKTSPSRSSGSTRTWTLWSAKRYHWYHYPRPHAELQRSWATHGHLSWARCSNQLGGWCHSCHGPHLSSSHKSTTSCDHCQWVCAKWMAGVSWNGEIHRVSYIQRECCIGRDPGRTHPPEPSWDDGCGHGNFSLGYWWQRSPHWRFPAPQKQREQELSTKNHLHWSISINKCSIVVFLSRFDHVSSIYREICQNRLLVGGKKPMKIMPLKQNKILKSIALSKKQLKINTQSQLFNPTATHLKKKTTKTWIYSPHRRIQSSPGWHETFSALGIPN